MTDVEPGARPTERWVLADDLGHVTGAAGRERGARPAAGVPAVRLVGPYDLFLQLRDRATLVPGVARPGPVAGPRPARGRARGR